MAGVAGKGGQKGRSGRKPKADERELQRLLKRGWPNAERLAAIKKFAAKAADGDADAFKVLLAYAYGKPTEKHDLTVTRRDYEVEIGGDSSEANREEADSSTQYVN